MNYETKFLSTEFNNSEQGLANIFRKYYKGHIVIVDIKKKIGYVWNEHTKIYDPLVEEIINNEMTELLRSCIDFLIKQVDSNELLDEDERHKKKKAYYIIRSNIGKSKTINSVLKFLIKGYYDKNIALLINNNEDVIPFKGGKLIDLKSGIVRDRTHLDYFTYEKEVSYLGKADNLTKNADNFFSQLCCDVQEKKEYLKLIIGSAITSYNKMKCFFIFYGRSGNNGKSTLMEIIQNIFNDMYVALPNDLIYNDNAEKVTDTQYGSLVGKTIATSNEPANKFINDPVIKLLTGADPINVRLLYNSSCTYTPKVKIFILLNNTVKIGLNDIMKKRTRVFNFNAEFVENPKTKNQYKIDLNIIDNFKTIWRDEFFTYIINNAIYYLSDANTNKQLIQPSIMDIEKTNYFNEVDYVKTILSEYFEFTDDPKDVILSSEICARYKQHLLDNNKEFKKSSFLKYMRETHGDDVAYNGNYYGNRLNNQIVFRKIRRKHTEIVNNTPNCEQDFTKKYEQLQQQLELERAKYLELQTQLELERAKYLELQTQFENFKNQTNTVEIPTDLKIEKTEPTLNDADDDDILNLVSSMTIVKNAKK